MRRFSFAASNAEYFGWPQFTHCIAVPLFVKPVLLCTGEGLVAAIIDWKQTLLDPICGCIAAYAVKPANVIETINSMCLCRTSRLHPSKFLGPQIGGGGFVVANNHCLSPPFEKATISAKLHRVAPFENLRDLGKLGRLLSQRQIVTLLTRSDSATSPTVRN
jgi:hypothetical protein